MKHGYKLKFHPGHQSRYVRQYRILNRAEKKKNRKLNKIITKEMLEGEI